MRARDALALVIMLALAACQRRSAGRTTGDGIPLSELDNGITGNAVTNVNEPNMRSVNQ